VVKGGGPGCLDCHNYSTPQNFTDKNGNSLRYIDGANFSRSVHANMNQANASIYGVNASCWACHNSSGYAVKNNTHPDKRDTPYTCTDCHLAGGSNKGAFNATIVEEHFINGSNIRTANATSNITSCINCHENVSEMILVNNDTDTGSFAGDGVRQNGGNKSFYHYGKNRTDLRAWDSGKAANCSYCHQNTSTAFSPYMSDLNNRNISNHSIKYNSSNPSCISSECHSSGWLHNSSLTKPSLSLPNSTYCLTCHGTPGSSNTTKKNLQLHNNSLNCTLCHLDTNKSIHPVKYRQTDNVTFATSNSSAVNCTTCHQGSGLVNFSNATRIPTPMNHSTNNYSGALWNGTQPGFWINTSQQSACNYCHGTIALHNSSGLGNITKVRGNNSKNQNLTGGYWCANCHYNSTPSGNFSYKGNLYTPQPPDVLNKSGLVPATARDGITKFQNHSDYFTTSYDDARCKDCHNNALNAGATSLNFSHNLAPAVGGANCTACHFIGAGVENINITAINDSSSIHKDLNKNAPATDNGYNNSKKCWSCHGYGNEPSEHPTRYKTPYNCTDCHISGAGQNFNYTPNNTVLNVTQHYWNGNSIRTPNATSCYACHNVTGMIIAANDPDGASANVYNGLNGGNLSVSHYGKKRSDMAAQQNTTPYCDNCHNGSSLFPFLDNANRTIDNHSTNYNATNPICQDCHSGGRIHNSTLTKPVLTLPNSTFCLTCHGSTGSATKKNLEKHNNTLNCTLCHLNNSKEIHPVKYRQTDNVTFATSNASAVN
ncbi:MAG: hypothetical protein Q7U60_08630, partial [Candidatus Methanoperedens sp.]|nr:hypothetical protein [Candidatus Methanoperedens sp.]